MSKIRMKEKPLPFSEKTPFIQVAGDNSWPWLFYRFRCTEPVQPIAQSPASTPPWRGAATPEERDDMRKMLATINIDRAGESRRSTYRSFRSPYLPLCPFSTYRARYDPSDGPTERRFAALHHAVYVRCAVVSFVCPSREGRCWLLLSL